MAGNPHEQEGPGGYPSGYDTPAYNEAPGRRALGDYLLIVRERIWYLAAVFLVVFTGAVVFTLTRTPLYEATSTVQLLRRDPVVMQVQGVVDNEIRSAEDLNTQVKVLESQALVEKVAARLSEEDRAQLLAPYLRDEEALGPSVESILTRNRSVTAYRLSLLIAVRYTDADPELAAKVANLFADEYLNYNANTRVDESLKAVDDLKLRAEEQRQRVDQLGRIVQDYRERNNLVSLDERKDIATEKLKTLNLYLSQTSFKLADATVRWRLVEERRGDPESLLNLGFISSHPSISGLNGGLRQQVANAKITAARLRERYRDKHPRMIDAVNQLEQTQRELYQAVESVAAGIEAEYQAALRNDREAREALAQQQEESLKLDRFAVDYKNLTREYEINEKLLENMIARLQETSVTGAIQTQNARIVDRAQAPTAASYPRKTLFLAFGLAGGLGLGLLTVFGMAYFDDRIKSSYDIESVVGLPLIGIIPEIESKQVAQRAQIAINQVEPQVAESFNSLQAALRIKDQGKRSQCILISSTIPGEGKSLITSNLALTCADHGERTILVDCDLRKPVIHRYMEVDNGKGVADYCKGEASLEEIIHPKVALSLDVITVGSYTKNPARLLSSSQFKQLIAELRQRYDRILLDTPPVAVVSDALLLLPLVDGFLYTIYFNRVSRRAAQFNVAKMLETDVPCFGAVLNGLNLRVADYYYAQYYNKAYQDYYVRAEADHA